MIDALTMDLGEALVERVHDVVARSERLAARSLVLVDASRYARLDEAYVPCCAWCGRVALGGVWLERSDVPSFVARTITHRSTDGICPTCFGEQLPPAQNELTVHAGNKRTAECLVEELRGYAALQRADHVLVVPTPPRDPQFVPRLLTLLAGCVERNALQPIRVKIGAHSYLLAGR